MWVINKKANKSKYVSCKHLISVTYRQLDILQILNRVGPITVGGLLTHDDSGLLEYGIYSELDRMRAMGILTVSHKRGAIFDDDSIVTISFKGLWAAFIHQICIET